MALLGTDWGSAAGEVFDGESVATSGDDFGAFYGIRVSGSARHQIRCVRKNLNSCSVAAAVLPGTLRLDVDPSDTVLLMRLVSGALHLSATEAEAPVNVGDWILAAENLPFALVTEDASVEIVTVNHALLRRIAAEHAVTLPHRIRFFVPRAATARKNELFGAAVGFARSAASDAELVNAMVTSAAARVLAAAVLTSFPNNVASSDHYGDRASQPSSLQQAVAYIEANAKSDIGIGDIAAHVHLTPRAVQYMFRRHLSTTPTEYLRHVRMEGAHRDLVTGDRSSTSVGDIAQRWGFAHTGRFAVMYRETYDQSPHTTLRG